MFSNLCAHGTKDVLEMPPSQTVLLLTVLPSSLGPCKHGSTYSIRFAFHFFFCSSFLCIFSSCSCHLTIRMSYSLSHFLHRVLPYAVKVKMFFSAIGKLSLVHMRLGHLHVVAVHKCLLVLVSQ